MSKRKKATANADALRAVIEKTKPITQFFSGPEDPECRSRFRQDPAFFFRIRRRSPSQKFVKNRNRSRFSFSAAAGVCVVYTYVALLSKTLLNFGCIDDCQSTNRSRILKLEKILDPYLELKTLEQERNRFLKMWLRPYLSSRRAPNLK